MSYTKYRNLVSREPAIGLVDAARTLAVGRDQLRAWASRHVSEDALLNPGSGSREAAPSQRIAAESRGN